MINTDTILAWDILNNTNFSPVKNFLPNTTIHIDVSCWLPEQIEEEIDKNLQKSKCILLTHYDAWRYTSFFKDKIFDGKIIVSTLGYHNVKFSDCYAELSYPAFYFSRTKNTNAKIKSPGLPFAFSCLNNRISIDRILLGYELFRENLLEKIIFSQNLYPPHDIDRNLNIFSSYPFIFEYFDFSKYEEYKSLLPIVADEREHVANVAVSMEDHTTWNDAYLKAYCNIVTETESEVWPYWKNENLPIVTEKTYKPFLSKQIPIYLAAKGHLKYLEKYGFETMADFLPKNYDNFNTIEKIKTIVKMVKLEKEYVEDFYFSHIREINHNYELVTSDKVEALILEELKEFLYGI